MDVSVRGEEPGTGGTVVCGPAKVPRVQVCEVWGLEQPVRAWRLKKRRSSDGLLLSMKKTQLSFIEYGKDPVVFH